MRKILLAATIVAILAIPMIAFASEPASPALTGNRPPAPECDEGLIEVEPAEWVSGWHKDDGRWRNSHWHPPVCAEPTPTNTPVPPTATPVPISVDVNCRGWRVKRGDEVLDRGEWSLPFELETAASNFYDGLIREPEECLQKEPTATPLPITLENSCAGWRVKQGGETLEGATWEDPYSLETHFSEVLNQRIQEPEECLKERGDPTLRIGGRCDEGGDSQEIGYVFDDGDFDGARLIITRQDGVEVANEGAGSGFFPARAAVYGWKIMWFNGETREQLDAGRFEVAKCDLPEPTPTPEPKDCSNSGDGICPDDPPEHPPTGGEIDAGLAVVTALSGLALTGIGGSILYMKRRASR